MLRVSKIYDDDYGCEERLPNQPKMAIVYLTDEKGDETMVKVPEEYLEEKEITEGSIWE